MTLAESTSMLRAASAAEDMHAIEAALAARADALRTTQLGDPEEISQAIDAGIVAMRTLAALKSRVGQVQSALDRARAPGLDLRG